MCNSGGSFREANARGNIFARDLLFKISSFLGGVPGFLGGVPGFWVFRDVPVFRCSGVPCSVFRCS